jgi:hypothetical protein
MGGQIIKVTNLNDSGPGSLRAAIKASGARVVVFEIGGLIWLKHDLWLDNPDVTIAGETAPSPGITLANGGLHIRTHDVVVRHLRVRVGDNPSGADPESRDAIEVVGVEDGSRSVYNVVIDHCSASWAIDENVSTWYANVHDVTVRYSIIAEGLSHSLHPKGEHSKGFLLGDHSQRASLIGNLFAHNNDRNPALSGDTSSVLVNNFIYNPGDVGIQVNDYKGTGIVQTHILGNLFRPGPSTQSDSSLAMVQQAKTAQVYMSENTSEAKRLFYTKVFDPRVSSPISSLELPATVLPSSQVENFVLANAGARPKDRDPVDTRIIEEVKTRRGSIIDSQRQVGGWPPSNPTFRALNPPSDPHGDCNGNGRSNLQEWLDQFLIDVEGT